MQQNANIRAKGNYLNGEAGDSKGQHDTFCHVSQEKLSTQTKFEIAPTQLSLDLDQNMTSFCLKNNA